MIAQTLKHLFPDIDLESECLLVDEGTGPRIAKWTRAEKQPTMQEIEAAWPAVQATLAQAALDKQATDDQQKAGNVGAKRAYARMQTIIDGADTATTVQLRSAMKEMAVTIQHLIRAAVK